MSCLVWWVGEGYNTLHPTPYREHSVYLSNVAARCRCSISTDCVEKDARLESELERDGENGVDVDTTDAVVRRTAASSGPAGPRMLVRSIDAKWGAGKLKS